uniref:Retroviral polymerase SH3-like domain-containing protein n=1 Tax=Nicotiana tabacum TaxID=4097 RepID=A0A1S3ZQ94_TOBAC|nr:PREDICTED: uncharacterized protein LOC107789274 [Nicotiana tabacum]
MPYELLNRRKPKLTHLRTFGCKFFVLNNGKEALRKFDAKSDEGIFLGYSSQSKAYKVYKKRTQCVEKSIHMIFNESHHPCEKDFNDKNDQDREQSIVPGEVSDMANGKVDMMSHVEKSNEDGETISPINEEELGPLITTIEAKNRVVDVVQGTPHAEIRRSQAMPKKATTAQEGKSMADETTSRAPRVTRARGKLHSETPSQTSHTMPSPEEIRGAPAPVPALVTPAPKPDAPG